jgi:hypothetical protein
MMLGGWQKYREEPVHIPQNNTAAGLPCRVEFNDFFTLSFAQTSRFLMQRLARGRKSDSWHEG